MEIQVCGVVAYGEDTGGNWNIRGIQRLDKLHRDRDRDIKEPGLVMWLRI